MERIKRISECPGCGANVLSVDPTSLTENKCPYCGYELYNHSGEIYGEKIEGAKVAKSRLISTQVLIAIIATLVVLVGGFFVINKTVYRSTNQYNIDNSDKITKKMQKAYEKEDWDTLYDMTIENFEVGMKSQYYYSYRAAWMLATFVPYFDSSVASNDTEGMMDAYKQIRAEYEVREELEDSNKQFKGIDDSLEDIYKFVPDIEDKLSAEYLREKEIMTKQGLLK